MNQFFVLRNIYAYIDIDAYILLIYTHILTFLIQRNLCYCNEKLFIYICQLDVSIVVNTQAKPISIVNLLFDLNSTLTRQRISKEKGKKRAHTQNLKLIER